MTLGGAVDAARCSSGYGKLIPEDISEVAVIGVPPEPRLTRGDEALGFGQPLPYAEPDVEPKFGIDHEAEVCAS